MMTKGTSRNADESTRDLLCPDGGILVCIKTSGMTEVPSRMKAMILVVQPNPILGCSWPKMMGKRNGEGW